MSAATYAALRLTIKLAVVSFVKSVAPTALVLPRAVFRPESDQWPNDLKSPDDSNKIHAIQVFFNKSGRDSNSQTPAGCFNPILGLGIGFYRQYVIGTDASNSEDLLDAEVSLVQYGIESQGLAGAGRHFGVSGIDAHEGLVDIRYNLSAPLGQSGRIHYAIGRLDILMSPQQIR